MKQSSYIASVEDLYSGRLLGHTIGEHHDAELVRAALLMAAAVRRGTVTGVIFHSDRAGEYTSTLFATACGSLGVVQSMGRIGSALDNAPAESFFSTLEHEVLSRHHFTTRDQARQVIAGWIDFYNWDRWHSRADLRSPIDYELAAREQPEAA